MGKTDLLHLFALVFTAVTMVVLGDTAGKLLTSDGADPFVIAWSRFALAALVLLPFSGLTLQELPKLLCWRVLLRAAMITCAISCILSGVRTEPIANVFGAFFIGPVVSYVLAILLLGERPSRERNLLLALGFLGVMLVVKPGFGVSVGMFFGLAAGTFYGGYLVMTRTIAGEHRPRFLLISQLIIGAVILTPFGVTSEIPPINSTLLLLVLVSALGSAFGNFLLVVSSKWAEASLIAPLVYSQLIPATVLGVVVFGDWPDSYALLGLTLIMSSGVGSLIAAQKITTLR